MAKKSDKKAGKKRRRASVKSDRELLELGEDLLTAVHLHHAVQDDEVRAALASAQPDLVQATGDLVARIAGRFLEESGTDSGARARYASWARGGVEAGGGEAGGGEAGEAVRPEEEPSASH